MIRKAQPGDEKTLAHIQTASWQAAFAPILPEEILLQHTDAAACEALYQRVLKSGSPQVLLLIDEGEPRLLAAWGPNRWELGEKTAELICIHSLPGTWRRGYGSRMLSHVLEEARQAGYGEMILWVFEANEAARRCYEKNGFRLTGSQRDAHGSREVMYRRML